MGHVCTGYLSGRVCSSGYKIHAVFLYSNAPLLWDQVPECWPEIDLAMTYFSLETSSYPYPLLLASLKWIKMTPVILPLLVNYYSAKLGQGMNFPPPSLHSIHLSNSLTESHISHIRVSFNESSIDLWWMYCSRNVDGTYRLNQVSGGN